MSKTPEMKQLWRGKSAGWLVEVLAVSADAVSYRRVDANDPVYTATRESFMRCYDPAPSESAQGRGSTGCNTPTKRCSTWRLTSRRR